MSTKKRPWGISVTSIVRRRKDLLATAARDKTPVPEEVQTILRTIMKNGFKSLTTDEKETLLKYRNESAKICLMARQANLYFSLSQIKVHLAANR